MSALVEPHPKIEVRALNKVFQNRGAVVECLRSMAFTVLSNEFAVVLGPSGCGKSTLLRIIAGLEPASEGQVFIDGCPVTGPGPDRGVVFQSYTSFPWLTVEENIEFGLRALRIARGERRTIVRRWIEGIGLAGFERAYPSSLSGGMQQRLAIARTLATAPEILLLDEPFVALDAQTRTHMHEVLLNVCQGCRATVLFVTHDVREAVYLADRVFVLSARPSMVRETIRISLPRPRPRSLIFSREFAEIERKLFDIVSSDQAEAAADGLPILPPTIA